MPIRQAGRRAIACFALLIAAGAAQAATKVTITSPAGEPLGGGVGTKAYTTPTATIDWNGQGSRFDVEVSQGTDYYHITLEARPGQLLVPGTYNNAERGDTRKGLAPGITVESHNGSCPAVWGSFVVRQLAPLGFSLGEPITNLEATFTFRCNSSTAPALTGTILVEAGPRYFSYSRDAGNPLGTVAAKTYYGNNSLTFAYGRADELSLLALGQRDRWSIYMKPPLGRTFAKGIYALANVEDATHASFDIYDERHEGYCTGLAGSINIRDIAYDEWGDVTGLYATWTLTCDGQPAAFRGTFHHDL
jgi:hypothetical protein